MEDQFDGGSTSMIGIGDNSDVVASLDDLIERVEDITYGAGSYLWFRGQPDYEFHLRPSIQRIESDKPEPEQYMATNFMIKTSRLDRNAPYEYDRARWLSLMQHYGLPTRLLDWSESPLIALYFALRKPERVGEDGRLPDYSDKDAALWCLDATRLNEKMGVGRYLPPMTYDGVRDYLKGAFKKKVPTNKIIACYGMGNDLRMYVQQSNFTVHDTDGLLLDELPDKNEFLCKLKIPAQVRVKLLRQLDLLGINGENVFPDMEHIAFRQLEMYD